MIRFCPKCGDYYADALLAFCLVDGTPLINVDASKEVWSEGARVIEEKEKALRKQKRKLKWRRVLLSAMMLLTALIVFVVALNSFTYVQTSPTPPPIVDATSTPTPTPTPVYKINGRVIVNGKALRGVSVTLSGSQSGTMMTDIKGSYTFNRLPAGGSYTVTPASAEIDFKPRSQPVKNLTQDTSADFVGTVQPKCSVADISREEEIIRNTFSDKWLLNIKADESKIIAKNMPTRVANLNAPAVSVKAKATLINIEYEIKFPKVCTASVTASYVWQVKTESTPLTQGKVVNVSGKKRFACAKTGETWRCS